jgi:hypothetical protein
MVSTLKDFLGFKCKTIVEGLKLTNVDLEPCPYQSLTSTNNSHKI